MLQSVLQAVFRLGRRDVDDEPDVHVHLHLHAGERLGRRDVDRQQFRKQLRQRLVLRLRRLRQCGRDLARLQLLPPVRLRLVQQCGRDVQLEPEFRLRLQPVLGLRDKPAQGRKPLRLGCI